MAEFFEDLEGRAPDEGFLVLDEIFHLEDQLAAAGTLPWQRKKRHDDQLRRDRCPARGPGDRGPVVGLRQLRDPVQGVRQPGHARGRSQEKIADAAAVHRFTGLAPSVALHIPWDQVDDYARAAGSTPRGSASRLGTINSNTFQDDDYKLGSLTHSDPRIRQKAIDHNLECIDVMDATGSRDLKIWLADGTNYPGQGDIRGPAGPAARARWPRSTTGSATTSGWCWSTSSSSRRSTTPMSRTGARRTSSARPSATRPWSASTPATTRPGTNIEFIVMQLLRLGKLGSFDFNSRFYADDDLIVGAADPFQLFRILVEVIRGGGYDGDSPVAFMLDQCHNIEKKIPGQIRSVLNVQEMTARALLVDADALAKAQADGDVLAANRVYMDAFYTDVRPDLAAWRESRGLPGDPEAAYAASGYQEQIEADRVGGSQAGWN